MISFLNTGHPFVQHLHRATAQALSCSEKEITGIADTHAKKVVVFVLVHFYQVRARHLPAVYNICRWYVRTVVAQCATLYGMSANFRAQVQQVLNELEKYESSKELDRRAG